MDTDRSLRDLNSQVYNVDRKYDTTKIIVDKKDSRLERNELLILDDFGLQPLKSDTRLALLQILEDRYKKKSTIIASQLPIDKWYEYIGDPTLADAIMDRLIYNAHKIELKGPSMRERGAKTQAFG